MKFYVISFILHIIFIFSSMNFMSRNIELDSKNVVVYLNELTPQDIPEPAGKKSEPQEEKKEEKKSIKEKEKKVEKKVEKRVVKKSANSQNIKKEEVVEDTSSSSSNEINEIEGLVEDGHGNYIGDQRRGGIGYRIFREVDPKYPELAKKVGFKDEVIIQTKFLVGLNGRVEEVIILGGFEKYGFRKEVEKALKKWEFEPITYKGKKIKMYFYKDFRFNVKN